jgi:hypothetical protein
LPQVLAAVSPIVLQQVETFKLSLCKYNFVSIYENLKYFKTRHSLFSFNIAPGEEVLTTNSSEKMPQTNQHQLFNQELI